MKHHLATWTFVLVSFLMFLGCKKKDVSPPQAPSVTPIEGYFQITTSKIEVLPFEAVILDISLVELSESRYAGQIGDSAVEFLTISPNQLLVILPEISAGKKQLKLVIQNKEGILDLDVITGATIADPDQYVRNFLQPVIDDASFSANTDLQSAIDKFNNLSEEDKMRTAQFIAANSMDLNELQTDLDEFFSYHPDQSLDNARLAACDWNCKAAQVVKICAIVTLVGGNSAVIGTGAIITSGILAIDIGLSFFTGKRSYLLQQAKKAFQLVLDWQFPQINYLNLILDEAHNSIISDIQPSGARKALKIANSINVIEGIQEGQPISFDIKVPFRTLRESDADSEDQLVSSIVSAYMTLKGAVDIDLPDFQNKEEISYAKDLNHFKIEVIEFSDVKVSTLSGAPEKFYATFSLKDPVGGSPEYDRAFKFKLIYDDGEYRQEKTFDAELGSSTNGWYKGTYTLINSAYRSSCLYPTKTGVVYFYKRSGIVVTYIKSVNPGEIPNLYRASRFSSPTFENGEEQLPFHSVMWTAETGMDGDRKLENSFRISIGAGLLFSISGSVNSPGFVGYYYAAKADPYKESQNYPTNTSVGCEEYKYHYEIHDVNAAFYGKTPPLEITESQAQQMFNLIEDLIENYNNPTIVEY